MPPEQLPWDRRDFRKHERSGSDPRFGGGGFGGGGPHRWREQHHFPHAPPYHHNHQQQQQQRWYSDFRSSRPIPPGHGKQSGWHMYPDDTGHGFLHFGSRYGERNIEDENFRPFGNRSDGRYFRNGRENRGSFSQKDWGSPSWQPAASNSSPGRPTTNVINPNNVENTETCHDNNSKGNDAAPYLPDSLQGQSQPVMKENHVKNGGGPADGLASLDQKSGKENGLGSLDWKPVKWNRSGSLSSRGSGLSHSSSSKSMGVDSEISVDVQQKNATPVQSPAAVCIVSTAPAVPDETSSRKKPRLGWGEGLAKYEKKKVEGPEAGVMKDGSILSINDTEAIQLPSANLLDKSPRVASLSECTSPATPSSVACSFSPGIEEKESIKEANTDYDTANLSYSPSTASQTHYEGPTFNLESLEPTSIANLNSLINELLQSNHSSPVETNYVRTTSMNKLLVWKVNILKALEVTESEIDWLETELRSLVAEPRSSGPHAHAASTSFPGDCHLKLCEEGVTGSADTIVGPTPLQVVSSGAMISENLPAVLEDEHVALKAEETDSPGSAPSKLIEVQPCGEDSFTSDTPKCVEGPVVLDPSNSSSLEKCLENGLNNEDDSCCPDVHKVIQINFCNLASVGNEHCNIDHVYDSILSSNRDSVKIAVEELNKLLPAQQSLFDISIASNVASLQRDLSVIKEKFLMKKRLLKFKEKVITLKFKVLLHFWKEGRVISMRKLRGKSHKKFDLIRTGGKKNRSSCRFRFYSSAGYPRTVPAEEVIEFVNGLLSESPFKPCRNTLRMPALILDKAIRLSRFITNNALVEDPCAVEKDRSMINPWTAQERELFIEKLSIFGKNFTKIASFLEHKTVADCVEFYYKNHKSEQFERARKKPDIAKQKKSQSNTYLVATGKRWNREMNAASLDKLREASVIAASVNDGIETQQKCTSKIIFGASSHKVPKSEAGPLQRSNRLDIYSNETVAADVLAGICGSLSSEAMSSCITSSVDFIDGYQDRKCHRASSCTMRPLTPDVTQNVECSDESHGEMDRTDWTDEEKSIFIQAVSSYGKDFLMISRCVRTRSREQCKIFFSKARKCLGLDQIQPGTGNVVSGDVNGGGSDTEDACVVQTHNLKPEFGMCVDNSTPCSLDYTTAEPITKNLSADDTPMDDKPAIDFNTNSKVRDGANAASVCEVGTLAASFNDNSVRVMEGDNNGQPNGLSEADNKAAADVSDVNHGEDNEGRKTISSDDKLESNKVEDKDANSTEVADITCEINDLKFESQTTGNNFHPSVKAHSSKQIESGRRMEAGLQTCNREKPPVVSLERNGHFASMESSTLFPVPIKYQRHSNSNSRLNGGANGTSEMNPQKTVSTVDCRQHLPGYSISDPVEFSQILRGHPVSVQTVKEINGDVNSKKLVPGQNVPRQGEKLQPDLRMEFSLQKCTDQKRQSEVVQATFPSQAQSMYHSRSQSCSSSDVEKPFTNGDVKLFGKILSSSLQKPDSCVQGKGDDDQHNKPGCQTQNVKFNGDQNVNLDSSQPKLDCNSYLGSENIPVRSFGFWEGNRTNTGFPPLPDSSLLLAKYPAAFSNHPAPTIKLQQPPLHGVIRSNDHSKQPPSHGVIRSNEHYVNGVSVFSRELSSSNGIADYQVLGNRELLPFALDVKQPQDVMFSDMQRRNGCDVVSGMQQQVKGMVGINVAGRGLLVGGQCSSVSDPVTAIKMHYAKAQNINMQAGNGVREDDAWTSNGRVGR